MYYEDKEESEENPRIHLRWELKSNLKLTHIDFIIPDPIPTSPSIYNYISVCGIGVKEIVKEEHADQREGNFIRCLEHRRLLPLWIFKENLKSD